MTILVLLECLLVEPLTILVLFECLLVEPLTILVLFECLLVEPLTILVLLEVRAQEVCESQGGCPGLPSLVSPQFMWM